MIHLHNHSFAPPPWKPHPDRIRGLISEEGAIKHSPSSKESAFYG